MKLLFPGQQVGGLIERSSCSRYELDLVQNLSALGSSEEFVLSGLKQEECKDGWTYSTEYYQSTLVTEVLNNCCYCCHTESTKKERQYLFSLLLLQLFNDQVFLEHFVFIKSLGGWIFHSGHQSLTTH